MIKTFKDFLKLAYEKHSNNFSYDESTFNRYSVDEMTIIHNKTRFRFNMIPSQHINSKTGIPKELEYNISYPFARFIEDIKNKLRERFYDYTFDENSYRGRNVAMIVYKNNAKYYISPYNMFYYNNFDNHLISEKEVNNFKELINNYQTISNFRKQNKKLYKQLSDTGFTFLWSHLDIGLKKVYYTEDYLHDLLMQYKNDNKSRSQFVMEHGSEHAFMRRNNLIHLYYDCGLTVASELPQGIYACEFNICGTKYAYVGLTFNFKERERDHRYSDIDSAVHKFIVKHNLNPEEMIFRIILEPKECDNASEAETKIFEQYKKEGWIMLNTAPTGSKGQIKKAYYTRNQIEKIIKDNNLKTVHELYLLNRRAWNIAREEGYINEILEKKTHKSV